MPTAKAHGNQRSPRPCSADRLHNYLNQPLCAFTGGTDEKSVSLRQPLTHRNS